MWKGRKKAGEIKIFFIVFEGLSFGEKIKIVDTSFKLSVKVVRVTIHLYLTPKSDKLYTFFLHLIALRKCKPSTGLSDFIWVKYDNQHNGNSAL